MKRPRLVGCDTMNYWIENKRASLLKTLAMIDLLVINDAETRELAGEPNLIKAARRIISWGPKILVIKRNTAPSCSTRLYFRDPGLPARVLDPTGAETHSRAD